MAVRILCLSILLMIGTLAGADQGGQGDARSPGPQKKGAEKKGPAETGPDGLMMGYGFVNNVNGMNLEWAFEHNSVYAIPGVYFDSTGARRDEVAWVAGFRHRLEGGTMGEDGFFNGVMVGHLDGTVGTDRLGAGGELGYQWAADHTRWTLSAGLVALEDQPRFGDSVEPEAFFAFSVSLL